MEYTGEERLYVRWTSLARVEQSAISGTEKYGRDRQIRWNCIALVEQSGMGGTGTGGTTLVKQASIGGVDQPRGLQSRNRRKQSRWR